MKIVGTAGDDILAQVSHDEIAVLLGFRSRHDEAFQKWMEPRRVFGRSGAPDLFGLEVQVGALGSYWNRVLHHEAEATKAAATLRALADLITTNLPSGILAPPPPPAKDD